MTAARYIYTSLTRIANLPETRFEVQPVERDLWGTGDYVAVQVAETNLSQFKIELADGRRMEVMRGDRIVGALGVRHATLEVTGSWQEVKEDGRMQFLTGAGLLGQLTSKSIYLSSLIESHYLGHILTDGKPAKMEHFVPEIPEKALKIPVVLLVGTSMSAGKTTAARVIVRQLKQAGKRVVGAKLTGAGRYNDILAMRDAGADSIFDFVDVGLPSSIVAPSVYLSRVRTLLSLLAQTEAEVAVIEIGASPVEPYNGEIAIGEVHDELRFTVLCASDPYAVLGVMESYGDHLPDIVSGPASNTLAGRELVKKLCNVRALNILESEGRSELRDRLLRALAEKSV